MKTRAAVAFAAGQPLQVLEVDLDPPGPGEVLIKMKATGLCHSDLHVLDGKVPRYPFPIVLGHEGCGVVLECGEGVEGFAPGDLVVPSPIPQCGTCELCISGKTNICTAQWVVPPSPLSYQGQRLSAFCANATFAEHAVIHQRSLAKVNSAAKPEGACFIGCGAMTGVGSALTAGGVTPGSSVVIFGLGGIGLNVLQGARIAGARQIIGVDINPAREEIGRRFGMTDFVNPADEPELVKRLIELTGGGADFTFDCVGSVDLHRQSVEAAHACWGRAVAVGIPGPGRMLELEPRLFTTGRVLTGALLGGERPKEAIPRLVDWYVSGFLEIDSLVSHVITFDEINRGFDMMKSGEATRTVVVF